MKKEKIIDVTGVELTPGDMSVCLGNGEHFDKEGNHIECCCDECDYMILCLKTQANTTKNNEYFFLKALFFNRVFLMS